MRVRKVSRKQYGTTRRCVSPSVSTAAGSAVGELVETQAPLQRQRADRHAGHAEGVAAETAAFGQERGGGFHRVARQAEMAVIEGEQRFGVGDAARGGQNGDA